MKNLQRTDKMLKDRAVRLVKYEKETAVMDKCTFSVDRTLVIDSWSPGMEKLSHKLAEETIGSKLNEIFPLLENEIVRVFKNGRRRHIKNFRNTCFMGTNLSAYIDMIPVKDIKGEVKQVTVILEGISGQCPLYKKVNDSRKMVEIGKIASSLAHGVRNPLNAIKGAVVYLQNKYGHESTLMEFSTIINEEIDRLDRFISNFLSAAKGELKFLSVNLNEILKSILTMIRPLAETKDIKISCNFSILPLITADAIQIEHALFNIINNSLEAMPGGGSIDIRTSMRKENGRDYVVIKISDTGKGIPEKKLRSLGELSDDSRRNDKGFGIFLSREIVKSHNGKMLWETVIDKGTTFSIFLPVKHNE